MAIFKGAGVAIVTPMKENLEVNYDKLEELVEDQIKGGTDAIIITGTTGESSTMTEEEHLDVIRACVNYTQIAQSVKAPIILYNVPGRTGCNLLPETVAYLHKNVENIVGLKEATGNITQASKTMDLTDGKIDMYSGEDAVILPLLAIGALGVISVWSNVAPFDVHNLCQSFFEGDLETSRKLQRKGLALIDALFSEVSPIPVKKAMNLMGKDVGSLRAPLCEMTEKGTEKLAEAMKAYGIL